MTPSFLIVSLFLIRIDGPGAMRDKDVSRIIKQVEDKFREVGIGLRIKQKKIPSTRIFAYDTAREDYRDLANEFQTYGKNVHVLIPPLQDDQGQLWFWGRAEQGSYGKYGFSLSTAGLVNAKGEDRRLISTQAMIHEIAHQLGAKHTKRPSIMHIDALALVAKHGRLSRWLLATKKEMGRHINEHLHRKNAGPA